MALEYLFSAPLFFSTSQTSVGRIGNPIQSAGGSRGGRFLLPGSCVLVADFAFSGQFIHRFGVVMNPDW